MIYNIKYTDDVEINHAGTAKAWFIKIRPKYENDTGLLEHEKTHVRQFWRTIGLHLLLYTFIKRYRLYCETEAYKKQLTYSLDMNKIYDTYHYAYLISINYGLDITKEEAYKLLS